MTVHELAGVAGLALLAVGVPVWAFVMAYRNRPGRPTKSTPTNESETP